MDIRDEPKYMYYTDIFVCLERQTRNIIRQSCITDCIMQVRLFLQQKFYSEKHTDGWLVSKVSQNVKKAKQELSHESDTCPRR